MVSKLPLAASCLLAGAAATQAPAEPPPTAMTPVDESFERALESAFPMTPDMVRRYLEQFEANAQAMRGLPEPEPISDAMIVSLAPGAPPPQISVAPGIASLLLFLDADGAPFPVRQYVLGDGENFEIVHLGEGSHAITVSPLTRAGWSNLVIALSGSDTPLVLRLRIDPSQAHYRRTIHVTTTAADHAMPQAGDAPQAGDTLLIAALLGSGLPDAARRVPVTGVDARAWLIGEALYLRSRHPLLSPQWSATLSGPDGYRAYRLPLRSVLLMSVGDRVAQAPLALP